MKRHNRISTYQTGWLAFLVKTQLATADDARLAGDRAARATLDEMERRRRKRRKRD